MKDFPIIVRLIYAVNFLLGTLPTFRKNNKKIIVVYKNIRKLYIASLFVITIICFFYNKLIISRFLDIKNGFNLVFILKIIPVISTELTTYSCWVISFTLSKYHVKIINNNSKLNELLMKNYKNQRIPFLNGTMILLIIFVIANFVSTVYFSSKFLKGYDFSYAWYYMLIFTNDWFIITYLMHQKINIHHFNLMNITLNDIIKVNELPTSNINTIIVIFGKLYENNTLSKYITSFPVNILVNI